MESSMEVTDATFESDVLERSMEVPVVVDLWASWCGPCRTLGPVIEKVVGETDGGVELAKVDVDANPRVAQTFQVQSIPAVYAIYQRKVVDSFVGALPEPAVRQWVAGLASEPTEVELLVAAGDEASLRRALELEPANSGVITALAALLVGLGTPEARAEAQTLLVKLPETAEVRHLLAEARVGDEVVADDVDARITDLLTRVKGDDAARQEVIDLLEVLGPDDPRTADYRKALTRALY
jgi:putative thioredoxin